MEITIFGTFLMILGYVGVFASLLTLAVVASKRETPRNHPVLIRPRPRRGFRPGEWQLYNVAEDPGETRDLANEKPELLKELRGTPSGGGILSKNYWQEFRRSGHRVACGLAGSVLLLARSEEMGVEE